MRAQEEEGHVLVDVGDAVEGQNPLNLLDNLVWRL